MKITHESEPGLNGDYCLLAYAKHMAETARSAAAKIMFELYLKQTKERLLPSRTPVGKPGRRSWEHEGKN